MFKESRLIGYSLQEFAQMQNASRQIKPGTSYSAGSPELTQSGAGANTPVVAKPVSNYTGPAVGSGQVNGQYMGNTGAATQPYQAPQQAGTGPNGQPVSAAQMDYLKFGSVSPTNEMQGILDNIDAKYRNMQTAGQSVDPNQVAQEKQTALQQYAEQQRQQEAQNTQQQSDALLGGTDPGTIQNAPTVPSNPNTTGDMTQNLVKGATVGSPTQVKKPDLQPFGNRTSAAGTAANTNAGGTAGTTPAPITNQGAATQDTTTSTGATNSSGGPTSSTGTTNGQSGSSAGGENQQTGNPFYTASNTNATSIALNAAFQQQYPEYADIFGQRNAISQGMHDALLQGSYDAFQQQLSLLPDSNSPIPGFTGGLAEYAQNMGSQLAQNRMNAVQTATANAVLQQQIATTNRDMTQVAANRAALNTATQYSLQQQDNISREIQNRTALTSMGVVGTTSTAGLDWATRSIDRGNTLLNQIAQDGATVQQGYTIQMTQGYQNAMGQAGVQWQQALTTAAKDYSDGYDKLYGTVNASFEQKQTAISGLVKDFKDKQFSADQLLGQQHFQSFTDLSNAYVQTQQYSVTKTLQQEQTNFLNSQKMETSRQSILTSTVNMLKGNTQMVEALKEAYPIEEVKASAAIYLDPNSTPGEKAAAAQRIVEQGQSVINPQSGRLIANQVGLSQSYQSAVDKLRSIVGQVTTGEKLTPDLVKAYSDFAGRSGEFFGQVKNTMLSAALLNVDQWNGQVISSSLSRRDNAAYGAESLDPEQYMINPAIITGAFGQGNPDLSSGGGGYGGTGSPSIPMGGTAPAPTTVSSDHGWFFNTLGGIGNGIGTMFGMNGGSQSSASSTSTPSGYGSLMNYGK